MMILFNKMSLTLVDDIPSYNANITQLQRVAFAYISSYLIDFNLNKMSALIRDNCSCHLTMVHRDHNERYSKSGFLHFLKVNHFQKVSPPSHILSYGIKCTINNEVIIKCVSRQLNPTPVIVNDKITLHINDGGEIIYISHYTNATKTL